MEQKQLQELFENTKVNKNFKYLIDNKIVDENYKQIMRNLYDEIIDSLKYYKAYYPEFARKMRSICTTIIRKALELFDIPSSNTDNTATQLLQLFNIDNFNTRNDVAEFAIRLAGIDVNKTIANFKNGKRIIWLNGFYQNVYHKHDTMNWTSNGSVSRLHKKYFKCDINADIAKIIQAYEEKSNDFYCLLISSIADNVDVMQNYVLRNMNQKFLSYIIHNTPGVNPFYNGENIETEEEQGVNNIANNTSNINEEIYLDSINNPYKFLESTINFINNFLIDLCITKFKVFIDKKEYNINFDLFNIDGLEVLNVLESSNKHYKLYLAREKINDDYVCYILQQYEFNELVDEKLFYNTTETANAMANCAGVIDINEVKFGDPKSDKYKIYKIKVGSYSTNEESLHVKTLFPEDLKNFSIIEKRNIIKSLFEQLSKMHKKRLFLRFIDLDSFVITKVNNKDDEGDLDLKLISIEYSKRKRLDSSITVKNYIPTDGTFSELIPFISNTSDNNPIDLSVNENALIVDLLYSTFMALYILSSPQSSKTLRVKELKRSIEKSNTNQNVKKCLESIESKFKELISLFETNKSFSELLIYEEDLTKLFLDLAKYLWRG